MKKLLVMRHAKSDWTTRLSDFERPLNPRGIETARRMGRFLVDNSLIPDRILSSSSTRTRETAHYLMDAFELDDDRLLFTDELYLADITTLMTVIENWLPATDCLLALAHNPGIDDLVMHLSRNRFSVTAEGKFMTTASIAQFDIDDSGSLSSANPIQLTRPRELLD